jgi:hypothetical protein
VAGCLGGGATILSDAATPAPQRCPAPKPLVGACGRYVYPGEERCPLHTNADSSRVCGAPVGSRGVSKPPCRSWPVVGRPYCYLHLDREGRHVSSPPTVEETLTGRVSESRPLMTPVDAMRAVVGAANPDTLAHLLNMVAAKLRQHRYRPSDRLG